MEKIELTTEVLNVLQQAGISNHEENEWHCAGEVFSDMLPADGVRQTYCLNHDRGATVTLRRYTSGETDVMLGQCTCGVILWAAFRERNIKPISRTFERSHKNRRYVDEGG